MLHEISTRTQEVGDDWRAGGGFTLGMGASSLLLREYVYMVIVRVCI